MSEMTKKVKVDCTVEGFEKIWVEFDTSAWGLDDIIAIYTTGRLDLIVEYVPRYTTAWNMLAEDGAVIPLPKTKEYDITWKTAFKLLGPGGRVLWDWLGSAVIIAMGQVITPPKSGDEKSA